MPKTILVVDDSATMRKIVAKSLRQAGFDDANILEAGDGVQALAMFDGHKIDILLSDINMPNMDGLELLRQLGAKGKLPALPTVMITTEASPEALTEARTLGARGTIKKPFTADQIQGVLGDFM